jgi:metal-responsive CopG/Arc/MetJ family transcriptional regulator
LARLNITLQEDLLAELSREVEPRKRSKFIQEAVARSLKELRDRRLAREYMEASADMRGTNMELEGVIGDGID